MDEQNQQGGSKKTLYIVIAIIVIIVIAWFGMGRRNSYIPGVDIQNSITGETTYTTEDGSVTVGTNKLPDNWPSDAPKYPNGAIQFSGTSNPQTGESGASVVFLTSDSVQTVADFYARELVNAGWTVEQTASLGTASVISATKDSRTFGAYIGDAGEGQTSVTVGISLE